MRCFLDALTFCIPLGKAISTDKESLEKFISVFLDDTLSKIRSPRLRHHADIKSNKVPLGIKKTCSTPKIFASFRQSVVLALDPA